MFFGGITAGKRLIHVYQRLGAFLPPDTLHRFKEQQYLTLRQLADALGIAEAGLDQGGVGIAPARSFST